MQRSTLANGSVNVDVVGIVASDGRVIFPEEHPQVIGYDAPGGNVTSITVSVPAGDGLPAATYVQTFTWLGGSCIGISEWVKQ